MSLERTLYLEQALLAVIAAAGQRGINSDDLCAQAVGGLMHDRYWHWVNTAYKHGAADEIDNALTLLRSGHAQEMSAGD